MVLCREFTLVKRIGDKIEAEPLKCRCWRCEYCAPLRQKQLRKLGYAGSPNRFLTLTVNPSRYADPNERARKLAGAWRNLRRRIMRQKGWKKLPFLAVFEKTKKGEPHLHILLRCGFIEQSWISAAMNEMIGAPIVDIRWVTDPKKAAFYVAKYVGKDPTQFEGCKRYWRSKDWEDPAKTRKRGVQDADGATFVIIRTGINQYAKDLVAWGRTVEWFAENRFRASHPLTGPPVYLRP